MSNYQNIRKAMAIEAKNKRILLSVNPKLNDNPGIYFLTREDENGFLFGYVGQAKHVLARLAQHMVGYQQHIDLSLKKHKLYSEDNPHGWKVNFLNFPENELDEKEQFFIKQYAMSGYQLRNKTSGSQGSGKAQINEYKPQKGYRDGIRQGKKSLARELSDIAGKHLVISLKPEKQNNKTSQKMFEKFQSLMDETNYE